MDCSEEKRSFLVVMIIIIIKRGDIFFSDIYHKHTDTKQYFSMIIAIQNTFRTDLMI